MKLVIDANIVFAALIKEGFTSDLIASPKLELYCPAYIFEEFEKYKTYLLNKTHREPDEFMRYYQVLKRIGDILIILVIFISIDRNNSKL